MKGESEIKKMAEEFVACKDILMAVGDENRLHLMIEMMQKMCIRDSLRARPKAWRTALYPIHLQAPSLPG